MWTSVRAFLKVYGLAALILAAALAAAWQFVAPPPPRSIVIAAGAEGGAYHRMARRWAAYLAREGVYAEVLATSGSIDNLRRVAADPPSADIAIVQGGVSGAADYPDLSSLGAVANEAVWVFHRGAGDEVQLRDFAGARIAIGPEGSGTRVLAAALIAGAGVQGIALSPLSGNEAADALLAGELDAVVFVSAESTPPIVRLLRSPGIALVDFAIRAEAFRAAFPHVTIVRLAPGAVSLTEDLPREGVTLLAPVAQVVASDGIHPQIVLLLVEAFTETLRDRQFFAAPGAFPATSPTDWPLHQDAARFYRYGPGILKRYLPFWVAVTIERSWVLVIPLLTILLPLSRIAPPLYRWQVERKIYRWYRDIRAIEADFQKRDGASGVDDLTDRLDRVEKRVEGTHVPLSYARPLYDLRQHIAFVRGVLSGRPSVDAERPDPITHPN